MFRKSGKQRRAEIKAARLKRAERSWKTANIYATVIPARAVAANHEMLDHVCTMCHRLPNFYMDRPFRCKDCGVDEVWTAKQQKWWYEIAKGHIDSIAVRCRPCRKKERARKAEARRVHLEGIAEKCRH